MAPGTAPVGIALTDPTEAAYPRDVPLPPLLALTLLSGFAAALAGRYEVRSSPRHVALTRSGLAYLSYALLVMVPTSVYFFVFHGDWFLLYLVDVSQIPSAIALLGFLLQAGLGMSAFILGAVLVRGQREALLGVALALSFLAGGGSVVAYAERLTQVGSYAQFHGQFGLGPFEGPLLTGAVSMSALASFGLVFLLVRLWQSGRR